MRFLCWLGIHKKKWRTFRSEGGMYNTGAYCCERCGKVWWL